ncbi:MAG: hypothetical protein KDA61_08570, partial [Planctomycetales bacterium]|nr:hypothetical protein [Planctomycetales bacterium]
MLSSRPLFVPEPKPDSGFEVVATGSAEPVRLWLDSEVPTLLYPQFVELTPAQIPLLTSDQIASIPTTIAFDAWSAEQRAALTSAQVPFLNIKWITPKLLLPAQREWLTSSQVQSMISYDDYQYLPASKTPFLTTAQISQVPNTFAFIKWAEASRYALTAQQVPALRADTISIGQISSSQRLWLTASQIGVLPSSEWKYLVASQAPLIPTSKIASITSDFVFSDAAGVSSAFRGALTHPQIQSLPVSFDGKVRINWLTDSQVDWLTPQQIAQVVVNDIPVLHDLQIPLVTPEQFSAMTSLFIIGQFSETVRANLSRAQLMALSFDLLSDYMLILPTQRPPENYVPVINRSTQIVDPPFPGSMPHFAYLITPLADATHVAIADGDWSDPSIWSTNTVPGVGAKVYIEEGRSVRFDAQMTSAIFWLRIDGLFAFATDLNTELQADTIVVGRTGQLHIGTELEPVADNVTARIFFPDGGPIDTVWDPGVVSRGLVSRGETRIFGRTVTPYAALSVDPLAGQSTLQLEQVPTGWRVGDELVVAGTNAISEDFDSEHVLISAISGTTVTLSQPLAHSHDAPDGLGLKVHVANLTRNVELVSEETTQIQQRAHVAFAENPNVKVEYARFEGLGRTDKSQNVTDPQVVDGVLVSGGENARARYAFHFHHTGVNPAIAPAEVRGNVVIGSPGWGYVIHSSNAVMEENVALDVVGAAFVGEDGNEIGAMRRNLVLNSLGGGFDGPLTRTPIHDFGHNGHGFWMQGPGIAIEDNIVSGSRSSAYAYFTASSKNMFDAVNLDDPSIAEGRDVVPVQTVPLRSFSGNLAYGVDQGMELWFHQMHFAGGETYIDDFTVWNSRHGIRMFYSDHVTIRNSTLMGRPEWLSDLALASLNGFAANSNVQNITFDNVTIEAYQQGVIAPVRQVTKIIGGRFRNIRNVVIAKGHDTLRTVSVEQPIEFVPLTPAEINGREAYDFSALHKLDFEDNFKRTLESLFSADTIQVALADGSIVRLFYADQAAAATPFPT